MTAIINNVIVQGKPEEIKELLELNEQPVATKLTPFDFEIDILEKVRQYTFQKIEGSL